MGTKIFASEVNVFFGNKHNTGVMLIKNEETRRPVVVITQTKTKKNKIGEPLSLDNIDETKPVVSLEFVSPRSIDVLIKALEDAKAHLIEDYKAEALAEMQAKIDTFVNG